jgi:hypothetical protein
MLFRPFLALMTGSAEAVAVLGGKPPVMLSALPPKSAPP